MPSASLLCCQKFIYSEEEHQTGKLLLLSTCYFSIPSPAVKTHVYIAVPIPSTTAIHSRECRGCWKRSTHPTQYISGAWIPWLSQGWRHSLGDCPLTLYVPTKNLSPKRINQSLGGLRKWQEKPAFYAGFSLSGVEF